MDFAQNLQRLMDKRGLTNYQLAKDLDIHPTTVANWLDGKTPRKKTLLVLADYFSIQVQDLVHQNKNVLPHIELDEGSTETQKKLNILARHLDNIPEDKREKLIRNFEDSIDMYLDAMGIPKEDE